MARVAELRCLRSDFDSDFTIEVHQGANSQDLKRTASEVRGQNWPLMARVAELRHSRSDFDSDYTIEVHLGANSQDFKENSLRGQRPKLASNDQDGRTQQILSSDL